MFLDMVGRRGRVVHHCLIRKGKGEEEQGQIVTCNLKVLNLVQSTCVQESKLTTSHIVITQHENYAGGKLHYSLFLLAPKRYLCSAET